VCASEDTQYMSSSEYIKQRIAAGEVFTKHILGEYETREEASAAEDEYLREYWDVPGRVNKALGFTYEFDDEVRAKHSVSMKAAYSSSEARAKLRAMLNRPDIREKLSKSAKIVQNKPEVRAKKSASIKIALSSPDTRKKLTESKNKPCTVDGITIYPSRKALAAKLGWGKSGVTHPHFQYVAK